MGCMFIFQMSPTFNPLAIILSQNKLTGPNYVEWNRNLDIVLTAEGYKFVLTQSCPDLPGASAPPEELAAYERWTKANEMTRCYILASIDGVLQQQHLPMPTARDIMLNLKEMFGEQGRSARQDVMRNLLNTKMAEGTPVREHTLKMIGFLNELEILGAEIDADSQIDIILQSLPDSFNQFRLNYLMNKNHYTLSELMNELQAAEGIIKSKKHVLMVSARGSSKLKPKGKKVMKKNKAKHVNKGEVKPRGVQIRDVPKGKCFHCGKDGHWKRNCPAFIASKKQGMIESLVAETCFVAYSTDTWCVDSGATNHVCNSLQGFQVTKQLSDREITLHMGTSASVSALAVGVVRLSFVDGRSLVLDDCLYVPEIRRNLISVSSLINKGYSVHFSSNVLIKKHGLFICSGTLVDGLYLVTPVTTPVPTLLDTEIMDKSKKLPLKRKAPSFNSTYLWHLRLGHINLNRIQRLVRDGPLGSLVLESLPTCESCLEGKMTKRQFSAKGQRAKELLELVHTDVCGPINIQARGGYEYFVTFVDDYSRFGYVYLMHRKSDAFDFFREFKTEAEKQTGKSLKALRSDRGGEYLSREFEDYLRHNGIVSQLTAPGTPQQQKEGTGLF